LNIVTTTVVKRRKQAIMKYKINVMTTTYPIWVNISYQGVLKVIIEKMLIRNAAVKQAERIYISFFNRLDVITKSFILGVSVNNEVII
jgi:hypothetical protein